MGQKVNIAFSDATYAMLQHLSRRLDVPMTEVVRLSITMLRFMTSEIDNGNRLLVEREGKLVEVVLLNLERLEPGEVQGTVLKPIDPTDVDERGEDED